MTRKSFEDRSEGQPADDRTDEARLSALLDAYGADVRRWPAADRDRVGGPGARSALAEKELARARSLDALLDADADLGPSAALLRRVAEIPIRSEIGARPGHEWIGALRRAFTLGLTALAAGVVLGSVSRGAGYSGPTSWDELSDVAFDGAFGEEASP